MGVCWTGTNKVNKDLIHFDTLEEEIKTYVTVVNKYGNGELKNWVTTIPETANQVDEFVKRVTYDKITSFNELKNNPALKEFVVNALNENMRTLVRASNEPASVIAEVGASQRLLAAAKFEDTILKTSTALHKFFRSLLRPFGLQDKIEPWVVRPNIIKLHPTAYNIYTKFFSLTNFADVAVKDFLHGSIKQLSKAVKADPVFQEHGINKEVFGRIFPVYDDQRRYAITNGNKEPQLFNNYLRQLLAENGVSNIDDNDLTAINVSFLRYKDMWNSINYGTIGEEHFGKNLMDMKPEDFGEQASLLRILYDIHKQYYELRDATSHTWTDNTKEVLERLHTSMANMKIRKGYIPGKLLNESDDIYASLSTQVKNQNLFNMVDYYFARDNTSYQEYEGDFFHILGNNVLGTSVLMQKLGLAGISDYLDYTLNRDTDSKAWFDGDPKRKEVEASFKFWKHDVDIAIKPNPISESAAKIKKITSMLGFIPAMIMWGPATAVRNIMAGTSNLFQSVGLQSRMGKFNQALNNSNDPWHQIAMFVNEQASKTLVHTGLAKEFEMFTDMSSPHKDVMAASQNFFMKLADLFGAETFLNMDISSSYSKLFSLKGSEKHMREEVKGLIFNNILNDINRIGIKFDTTEGQKSYNSNIELISKMYQQHEQNAFFKITRALGDFSPLAKPYWTHGFQDNASKSGAALTGALLKWLYMFRHPMLVNTENTLLSITELLYDKSMSGTVDRNKIAKGGMISAALMFATYELFKDILWEQEAYVGSLETLNPLQDLNKPMRLAMASILAPIFGLKVTEENARKIEAENIRFLANMLGGNALASAYREDRTMKDFYQSWVNVFNLPSTLLDVIVHGSNEVVSNGKTNALYDKRHQFRKQWGELTSLDPIWLVERFIEYNTIKDPYDKASTVAFRKDTMLKNLATWVGISVYGNTPERVWNAYGSTYWSDQAYDDTKTYLSKRRLYPYNGRTANRFVNSIENYGKAPSPSSEIVRIR